MAGLAAVGLAALLAHARPGDVIRVMPGVHRGRVVLTTPGVTLVGSPGAILDGQGKGSVIEIRAPGCTVANLEIVGSGESQFDDDAAIRLEHGDRATIRGVRVHDCLNGLYIKDTAGATVQASWLQGDSRLHGEEDGDGVHVFHSTGTTVMDSHFAGFRDGCYLEFSPRTRLARDVSTANKRYGLHVMFTDGTVYEHCTFAANTVGSVLMNSRHIVVRDNRFVDQVGPVGQALCFKENDDSVVEGNVLSGNTVGLFVESSERNVFRHNRLTANGWGLLLFASSHDNRFTANTFRANDFEVAIDMPSPSNAFEGNYWSSRRAMPGQDTPYCPLRPFGLLAMQNPDLMAFAGSPAARALDAAFAALPGLGPHALLDQHPLKEAPQ